eukprot:CAMPEP_0114557692 /NCGR_PEP_ID=MMETSP0114-20121206/9969_1 /TAXON_ID=31324 /ORGANISM="Goniomonas sp, Strain m" /LENGTH=498 /DNA_ID=CAMNT_0001743003 /DNA_START=16 /DNA_END=1515 /DNA_ORIENTATION=-
MAKVGAGMDVVDATGYLLTALILLITILIGGVIEYKNWTFISDGSAAVVLGMIAGGILRAIEQPVSFDEKFFFNFLLPPIIFFAGFSLKRRQFFRNLSSILLFAYLGTIISTLVVGFLCLSLDYAGLVSLNAYEALLFGALISAVDPVATLSAFQKIEAPKLLYNLVFGEAVLNDAVAVVIFTSLLDVAVDASQDFTVEVGFRTLGVFIGVSIGSTAIGMFVGLIGALALRTKFFTEPKMEMVLILLVAYVSYQLAQTTELSGIMSIFFCGICSAHYSLHSVSSETGVNIFHFFETLAFLAEMAVFGYLGVAAFELNAIWNWGFNFSALAFCLFGRACTTFPISLLCNIRRKEKIPFKFQFVMWWSGLRGSIAVALAFALPKNNPNLPNIDSLLSATLTVVLFTSLIMGGLTGPVLKVLGIEPDAEETMRRQSGIPEVRPQAAGLHKLWKDFDNKYMKKVFGGSHTVKIESGLELEKSAAPMVLPPAEDDEITEIPLN